MAGVRKYTELDVWKLSNALARQIRDVIDRPAFRRYPKLREQIDGAAESPPANIAEGFGRYYPGDNARFVRIAVGSLLELTVHLARAQARRLITAAECDALCSLARRAKGAATGYLEYLQTAELPPPRPRKKAQRKRENATDRENRNSEPER
jgi:four helix bundle protein